MDGLDPAPVALTVAAPDTPDAVAGWKASVNAATDARDAAYSSPLSAQTESDISRTTDLATAIASHKTLDERHLDAGLLPTPVRKPVAFRK